MLRERIYQIFLSSTYIVREHAPAMSRVHLREHGARALSANMHTSLGETSLSFLRLLSKQFSCHLAIFSCRNKLQRAFLKKMERHVWCLDDVVRMPATRLCYLDQQLCGFRNSLSLHSSFLYLNSYFLEQVEVEVEMWIR